MTSPKRLFALPLVALLAGCPGEAPATDASSRRVVVYCGRGEALLAPLLARYQERTGAALDVRYSGTPTLSAQLRVEGDRSPADVVIAQECGALGAIADLLAPLPDDLVARVDPRFRDPGGRWVGTSGRARVLVHDAARVKPEDLPRRLEDLADPRWKGRVGWAPGNASFQAHVSALRHLWGEARARAWLEAMIENAPRAYAKNGPIVEAVAAGEVDLGWVNHYYLLRLKRPGSAVANASFAEPGDAGNLLMLSGAAVRAGSPVEEEARRLVAFLVSDEAQEYFARETFEYPVVPGVATHPDVAPLEALGLATVDPVHLTDLEPTLELLRRCGLQ
ncbi:MAG: extracellular solute-binding protein [Planctomycetes bacterium]|nr:extracellular solute-binding protein [Planctomycetota bacterium]